jgi:hypothetical protein
MLGSFRSNATVGIAVPDGIAGLAHVLAASAAPPGGTAAMLRSRSPTPSTSSGKGYFESDFYGMDASIKDFEGGSRMSREPGLLHLRPQAAAEAGFIRTLFCWLHRFLSSLHLYGARGSTFRSYEMEILGFPIASATAQHVAAKRASAAL